MIPTPMSYHELSFIVIHTISTNDEFIKLSYIYIYFFKKKKNLIYIK